MPLALRLTKRVYRWRLDSHTLQELSEGSKIYNFPGAFLVQMLKLMKFLPHMPLAHILTKRIYIP